MSEFEKRRLDREFQLFAVKNFENPRRCRNLDQIRYYVQELSGKVNEFKERYNYVPDNAYSLLAQYNNLQNRMLLNEFKNSY
ncbi:MAG: hypothetical protein ACNS60_03760 [Candidatus Cyclobacteriaceae bacterium M2_1C_046]